MEKENKIEANKVFVNARYAFREDTLENWETNNPILEKGEPSIVRDGLAGEWLKIGDGVTPWNELPYKTGPKGKDGKNAAIDQTYNPESENAQSGIAIERALSGITPIEITDGSYAWWNGSNGVYELIGPPNERGTGYEAYTDYGYFYIANSTIPTNMEKGSKIYIEVGDAIDANKYYINKLELVGSAYIKEENLKTINGQSIVGSGDIEISGGNENEAYELIETVTVTEAVDVITRNIEPNGKDYNLKDVFVVITVGENKLTSGQWLQMHAYYGDKYIDAFAAATSTTTGATILFKTESDRNLKRLLMAAGNTNRGLVAPSSTALLGSLSHIFTNENLTKIKISHQSSLPIDLKIEIWGVRA